VAARVSQESLLLCSRKEGGCDGFCSRLEAAESENFGGQKFGHLAADTTKPPRIRGGAATALANYTRMMMNISQAEN
jgi:hypothetical protein